MRRELIGYGADDQEAFSAELDLDDGRLARLRGLLDADDDDPELGDVYEVSGEALEVVADWLDDDLDPDLDYFLEAAE